MKKKIQGIIVCLLLIATTVLVAGNKNTTTYGNDNDILNADDFIKSSGKERTPLKIPYDGDHLISVYEMFSHNSPIPDYAFIKVPTPIVKSYYDYMPGSYSSYPIGLQTQHGNGHYLTFMASLTSSIATDRRQMYAYVNGSTYDIQKCENITTYVKKQGYGSLVIHPATGDPLVSWHEADYRTAITYDDYDAGEIPGLWQSPLLVPLSGDNQYIWPAMSVGPSPQGSTSVRFYQVSNNNKQIAGGLPCEDVRIMYTDVPNNEGADLTPLLDLGNWSNVTVFTSWREKACRPFQSFAIDYNHPGKVAFIGYAVWLNGDQGSMPVDEGLFVWESFDYGQTWNLGNLHSDGLGAALYKVKNPGFEGAPTQLDVTIAGFHDTAQYDSEGNLHWTFMQQYGFTDGTGSYYYPHFLPQAEAVWDGSAFTFHEVPQLPGTDPLSGHSVPWTDISHLYPVITWSTYPNAQGEATATFHENTQKQAINVQKNWLAQVWVDGTYAKLGDEGDPKYTVYIHHPIIYISVSGDNGKTWSTPINLTDIRSNKFNFGNQITIYPYVCNQITDLGDDWGQLSLYYYNDKYWGSYVQGQGQNLGGNITYCSIKIKFPEPGELLADAGGPYQGNVGENIQFFGSATGGVSPYTWHWDFGDGNTSDLRNPVHNYSVASTYPVTLTVTDSTQQQESDQTTAIIICPIEIEISDGLGIGITAVVKNNGTKNLTNVSWSITVIGGLVAPREKTGTISQLEAGDGQVVKMFILGIGLITITVTAGCAAISTKGVVFLFFVWRPIIIITNEVGI